MIIQLLGVAFILAFSAIAILGHVLLVLAVFTPVRAGSSQTEGRLHQAELPRARIAAAFFTCSSSSLMRRTSFVTQRMTAPPASAPRASLTKGETTKGGMDGLLLQSSYNP